MTQQKMKKITERWYFFPACIAVGLLIGPALTIYFHYATEFVEWVIK